MKKLLLISALSLLTISLSAQGLKGTWFAGGQVSFKSTKDKNTDDKITNFTVLPIVGCFITPDVAIGAGIGYMHSKVTLHEGLEKFSPKNSTFIFKPLVRKYWNITGGLFFFGQAALPISFGSSEFDAATSDPFGVKVKSTGFNLELSPGFDYVINSWCTIETSFTILSAGYNSSKPKGGKAVTSWGLDANPFNSVGDRTVGELQVGVKFLF